MAATPLIPSGTTAGQSADVVLADGTSANFGLFGASNVLPRDAAATVQYRASNGVYIDCGRLTPELPVLNFPGPATYRVAKAASVNAFGVDSL